MKLVLDGIVDLVADTPDEVWDCVFTLKELVVSEAMQTINHGPFIPAQVLDCMLALENEVAGGVEPEVCDVLNFVVDEVCGGPEPDVVDALETMVAHVTRAQATELMDAERTDKYVDRKLVALYAGSDEEYRGRGTKAYVHRTAVQPSPMPGTGLIFIDFTSTVFGDGVSTAFDAELRVGDMLLIEQVGGAGLEGREVASITGPAELALIDPYSSYNVQNAWLKNWGYQRVVRAEDEGATILEEEARLSAP